MEQTREDRMRQRMRGAARHQVQNADFGDLVNLAIPAPEPEPEAGTESSESPAEPSPDPTPAPVPAKRTSPNTSAKRRRLNSEAPIAPVQNQGQPSSAPSSSANRSSRRERRAPANPDPYDLENAPSTVHSDGAEEQGDEEAGTAETTPKSRVSKKRAPGSARSTALQLAAQNQAPLPSSPLKSLRGEEVTESPADEPGSGHRRRVRANGAVTSSAILQSALRSANNDTGHDFLQSSSPLSRKSRKSTVGTAASVRSQRTGLRRSTRLSGSPDEEVNELSSDLPMVVEEAGGARGSSEDLAQEEDAPEVVDTAIEDSTVIRDDEAEEAQEINDEDAALRLGRKRQRRSESAGSPELSPESPDEPVAKRPRQAPPAKKKSPAKQRQPKAPRAKANKPAAPRKKKDGDTAEAVVAVKIQRFTRPRRVDDADSGDEDPLNSAIPYASRSGVNAVDVFAQMCEEVINKSVENIKEGIRNAPDTAAKKELRVKLMALQAFRVELRTRLLEHTIALDTLFALKKRVRKAQREKLKLRERIVEIRAEREQVHLRMDAVRIKHDEDSKEALHNINLSAAMHDVDLAIEQGRAAPELSAKEQKTADLANLELLISRVAEQACSNGPVGGALKQIKSFNAFLERAAAVL